MIVPEDPGFRRRKNGVFGLLRFLLDVLVWVEERVVADCDVAAGVGHVLKGQAVLTRGRGDQRRTPGDAQVWSLTQFFSVDFSQSRISVKKCIF